MGVMGRFYLDRQCRVSSRFTTLQETFVRAPKPRDWLQADQDHPALLNKNEKINKTLLLELEQVGQIPHENHVTNKIYIKDEKKEETKITQSKANFHVNFNHPIFQPRT